jgi:hypothetical protein
MSLRSWLALLVFYVLYLLAGAYIFNALENPTECSTKEKNMEVQRDAMNRLLTLTGKNLDIQVIVVSCLLHDKRNS